ncbi:hypothetical protein TNCV_5032321 [Trichonephila clavipes]|nr:hypothetical protein TNCV_5032321 [Trichonephila clavipes]
MPRGVTLFMKARGRLTRYSVGSILNLVGFFPQRTGGQEAVFACTIGGGMILGMLGKIGSRDDCTVNRCRNVSYRESSSVFWSSDTPSNPV